MFQEILAHRPPLSEGQPQPNHVPPAFRLGEILEPGARMHDRVVVAELHVPDLQIHIEMDLGVARQRIDKIEGRQLE
jgi:hypothetical protein